MRIYLLLGGFFPGPDGYVTSAGFHVLRAQLASNFPDAVIQTYQWSSYQAAADDMKAHPADKHVVIGYSGGGSRFTWMATANPHVHVDLAILYDPSPSWQMKPVGIADVDRVVSYENKAPFFFGLGGGHLVGRKGQVEIVPIAENHMAVQFDQGLHEKTISYIRALVGK